MTTIKCRACEYKQELGKKCKRCGKEFSEGLLQVVRPKPEPPALKTLAEMERDALTVAITRYSLTKAAAVLGIDRGTMRRKMRRYMLTKDPMVQSATGGQ